EVIADLLRMSHPSPREDLRHRHESGGNAERIRVEGARMANLARDHLVHDRGRPADGREGEATSDRLSEHLDVRGHAERLLRPAVPLAARLDLVEDQERADLGRDLSQTGEESR